MNDRERRVSENEALFREVNDRIATLEDELGRLARLRVVCECGEQSCVESIDLSRGEYEAVRADPERFVIKPGHEIPEVEEVVERHDHYWVVAKGRGAAARIARATNPRR